MIKNKLVYFLALALCLSCTSETEKHQNSRNNIVNVKDKIKEIEIKEVLINGYARVYIMNNYFIIVDSKSFDNQIHIFDKNDNFKYLAGTAPRGQGPDEITVIGHVEPDNTGKILYVTDHGKLKIFSYDLDSVLANPKYRPEEKLRMNNTIFPEKYTYINDTLCIGVAIAPIGYSDFRPVIAKWNMSTGEIIPMKYEHPEIEKPRIACSVSMEHGIYVTCYHYHDLITICNLDGNLKYNIYGRSWDNRRSNEIYHYGKVIFVEDKILASYSGGRNFSDDERPTKFLIFDIHGDYLKTIETGYKIDQFCYDQDNNRILLHLDAEIQFACLDLDGII